MQTWVVKNKENKMITTKVKIVVTLGGERGIWLGSKAHSVS